MSAATHCELPQLPAISAAQKRIATSTGTLWEGLSIWLTHGLQGVETTIERRIEGAGWMVECSAFPLESVTVHSTANNVQVVSISVRVNGAIKQFDVTAPDMLCVRRNASGWPVRVELGNAKSDLVLLFSGKKEPAAWATGNSWGE
ncbi:MAG TPA: hypothetical protein VFB79_00985 [Candidatus Angelobacter sp.]|nr:hypothetical protein [Candidatus Angelobacter sp.]